METRTKLTKARTRLVLSQPFFGSLALRMGLIENPGIETMATNGRDVYFNPSFVDGLTMDELVGVLAHEVMHPACNHHTRRGGRDAERWNIAADYAINPVLVDNGFTLPEGALLDPAHAGLSAEAIYNRLPPAQSGGGGQDGNCPDPGRCGGVMDAPGGAGNPSPVELASAEAEWRQAVAQSAAIAKNAGKLPGDLARIVDEVLHPKADWREILRRFVENVREAGVPLDPAEPALRASGHLPALVPVRADVADRGRDRHQRQRLAARDEPVRGRVDQHPRGLHAGRNPRPLLRFAAAQCGDVLAA